MTKPSHTRSIEVKETTKQGLIVRPIPENVGRSPDFLRRCAELLASSPFFFLLKETAGL